MTKIEPRIALIARIKAKGVKTTAEAQRARRKEEKRIKAISKSNT